MERQGRECGKLEQNGDGYKLQAAEMGFTTETGKNWRCETLT
jgi:hypothetical protein